MTDIATWISVAAALVSAVGGAFAARAAFVSARLARETRAATEEAEHRSARRQIGADASAVVVEAKRVSGLVDHVIRANRGLAALQGGLGGSRLQLFTEAVERKRDESKSLAERATLFSDSLQSLKDTTADDLERIRLQQREALHIVQALREDLVREQESLERQQVQVLESMDRTRLAR